MKSYRKVISTERLLMFSIPLIINLPACWEDVIVDVQQSTMASEILEPTVTNLRKRGGPRGILLDPRFTAFKVQNSPQLMRSAPEH